MTIALYSTAIQIFAGYFNSLKNSILHIFYS